MYKLSPLKNTSLTFIFFLTLFPPLIYALEEPNYSLSMYAVQSDTGDVLIDTNSHLSLSPASCMKIITTAAALHILGPKHHFETHLAYDGLIDENKTLHGNLYILGRGDPCLGFNRILGSLSMEELLDTWVAAIQNLGIQKIEGKIIGDASHWESALAVPSWTLEDVGNYYGAGASALSFHENFYSLFFKPGPNEGDPTSILRTEPRLPNLIFQNEIKTGPEGSGDRACIYGSELSSIQSLKGTVPANASEFSIKGAIPDPATFCANALTLQIQKTSITIRHQDFLKKNLRHTFHTTYSPAVEEIVYQTNQKSINLYAEHLLKKMGEMAFQEGSTKAGTKATTDFLRSQNINLNGFNMADGSGLSRKNLITTKQLVSVLLKMKKYPLYPIFLTSLPEKPEKGHNIRAKSGSMSLIRGCAGYIDNIAFAILINQCLDDQVAKEKIQAFLDDLTQISQKQDK